MMASPYIHQAVGRKGAFMLWTFGGAVGFALCALAGQLEWGLGAFWALRFLTGLFSGAGLVTLFGGVLAARQLYDLIGPEAALAGLVIIALFALVLGWFHGPLLAAVGLIGAFAAPFMVGGASDDPSWLYGYFFIIAILGLGIDTVRRWAWILL